MELLKTIKEQEVYPDAKIKDGQKLKLRKAIRAVVFDAEGRVAIINVKRLNYYKLPGGGIEEGETMEDALKRECSEEIGCNVNIGAEIGKIIELRNQIDTRQESICFIAKISGEKREPNYVGYEIIDGFIPVWVDINEALKLVENSKPTSYDGPFIKIRDLVFLEKAKDLIKK